VALARKRHAKAEAELDRAVAACLSGAMDMKLYRREQERLKDEIRTAERRDQAGRSWPGTVGPFSAAAPLGRD
jgi:hypothetical protein